MATILRAPDRLTAAQKKATTTLFLAGPFDDDDGEGGTSWRDEVIDACADLDISILDPRNDRWSTLEAGSPGRRGAYEWQCAAAFDADVVIVWVPAGSHAPTAVSRPSHRSGRPGAGGHRRRASAMLACRRRQTKGRCR